MTNLRQVVHDERTAPMVLSMIVEPNDAVTGRLLVELRAPEVPRLAERDNAVAHLSAVDAQAWRAPFEHSDARTLEQRIIDAERWHRLATQLRSWRTALIWLFGFGWGLAYWTMMEPRTRQLGLPA